MFSCMVWYITSISLIFIIYMLPQELILYANLDCINEVGTVDLQEIPSQKTFLMHYDTYN